jgi:hypothetical protein
MSRSRFSLSEISVFRTTWPFTVLLLIVNGALVEGATVAHYNFESKGVDAPLYELTDSSGRGHHGMVLGRELFELTSDVPDFPGLNTGALDARGRLDHAVIPHHPDFASTNEWTIEFFIKAGFAHRDSGGVTNIVGGSHYQFLNTNLSYTILAKHNTTEPTKYGSAWAFHYQPAQGWVVFTISYGSDKGEVLLAARDLRDGEWHHIAVVFKQGVENELGLYVDGFNTSSINQHGGNIPISWGTGPIYVGAWARQDSSFDVIDRNFDGMLDEIRFSDVALDERSFVVDFTPYLYGPIPVEFYAATEVQFEAAAGKHYRIEETEGKVLGYAVGEGGRATFFHRGNIPASSIKVIEIESGSARNFETLRAVEIRFPSEPGQLYRVFSSESLGSQEGKEDYLLGDGAKMSHFERVLGASRYFHVQRY